MQNNRQELKKTQSYKQLETSYQNKTGNEHQSKLIRKNQLWESTERQDRGRSRNWSMNLSWIKKQKGFKNNSTTENQLNW